MTVKNFYTALSADFKSAGIDSADFEARLLISHALNMTSTDFLLRQGEEISETDIKLLAELKKRRLSGEPVQYIIGSWDFMGSSFEIGKGVLIPRPETEELCEKAFDILKNKEKPIIYDLCSGSGCIGITLKKFFPEAEVYLIEKSEDALVYLLKNAEELCYNKQINIIKGDVFDIEKFAFLPEADLIISNPPYIKKEEVPLLQKEVLFEPSMALDGGDDGLDFYRFMLKRWKNKLKPNGEFAFEIGEDQGNEMISLFAENGLICRLYKDYSGNNRIVTGRMTVYDI